MIESNAALTGLGGSVGGLLIGLIVSKMLKRTASNIDELPKLYWRVESLEDFIEDQKLKNAELEAIWRELAKAKDWISNAVEIARAKGIELTTPRWGKEP